MKKIILLTMGLVIASFVGYAQYLAMADGGIESVNEGSAYFKWESGKLHDFGKIKKGVPVTKLFEFVNSGTETLKISKVKGSCGCTVTDYTKENIAPGEKGMVKATYNAAKIGTFSKTVTVTANTPEGNVVLHIKGEVVE